jgi:hypothetical protein
MFKINGSATQKQEKKPLVLSEEKVHSCEGGNKERKRKQEKLYGNT